MKRDKHVDEEACEWRMRETVHLAYIMSDVEKEMLMWRHQTSENVVEEMGRRT